MVLPTILSSLLVSAVASAASIDLIRVPRGIPPASARPSSGAATFEDPSDAPRPSPAQTVGSYFEVPTVKNITWQIRPRIHQYDGNLMVSTWSESKNSYNLSLDKCLTFDMVAGKWTSRDGTRNNATILDINDDMRFRLGSAQANEVAIAQRVLDNAQRATVEAEEYLTTATCGYSVPNNDHDHDELRHLLAPDGFWIAMMIRTASYAAVTTTVYKEKLNPNATASTAALVAIAAAGLSIMDGAVGRLQGSGRLSYLEAQIISVFTAWFRNAVQVGADGQVSGCLPELDTQNAIAALPYSSVPSIYYDQLQVLSLAELGEACMKHD